MTCIYQDVPFNTINFITHKDPLASRDGQFLNVLSFIPVGGLLQISKELARHSRAKAKLLLGRVEV
jgi:hypothetical protein